MEYASVKVSKNTLRKARIIKGKLMQVEGHSATDDEVFRRALEIAEEHEEEFLKGNRGNWDEIKKLAGSIKLTDKEADEMIREIRELRRSWRSFA